MEASALKPVESARLNMDDMPPETIRARDIEGRMSRRDAGESFLKKTFDVIKVGFCGTTSPTSKVCRK